MIKCLLTGLLFTCFVALPDAAYPDSEAPAFIRYFAEGRVAAVTSNSADIDGEVLVLLDASDRHAEQVVAIQKHFTTALRIVIQVRDLGERYEAKLLRSPDENLNLSLRLKVPDQQFKPGETLKLELFLYGT